MRSHDARLTTNDDEDASVAEHEDEHDDHEEREEIPDTVSDRRHEAIVEQIGIAETVDHGTC